MKTLRALSKTISPATLAVCGLIGVAAFLLTLIHPAIAAFWLASTAFCTFWTHA